MEHYNNITMEFDGVACRLSATTEEDEFRDVIVNKLVADNVYEHVHVYINPEPTNEIRKYMIFVGGKQYEDNEPFKVFGREVHGRTRQHL